ncbi:MAG: prepilin-type N-terminal cleavage/methylation domain-containing protein [Planctomycetota bacterium]|jgi:prepilin-type N-terminal cleavage/methylation domain-containing protein/prepilin-type processing-associated H-X9-DG protein
MPGFTLVELLVVIGIIALLLSILMPTINKAKTTALRIKCSHNLKQIILATNLYLNDHDQTYICADDPVSISPYYWLWMGRGWRPYLEKYFNTKIDMDYPSVLLCPQDPTSPEKYESTSYGYSMAFYHSPEQIDSLDDPNDTYSNVQSSIGQHSYDVAHPFGKIIFGEWLSNHQRINNGQDPGWWGWKGRRNFVFVDGHVQFIKAKDIREANDGFPDVNLTIHGIKGIDWPR